MVGTAGTRTNSDEFVLRAGFPPGLVVLGESHISSPILMKGQ